MSVEKNMTKYERLKQAMLKLAVKKKIKKLGYKIVAYDYITRNRIIDFVCLDEKNNQLVFIILIIKKTSDFVENVISMEKNYMKTNIVEEMEWFKKSHNLNEYEVRLDGIEGYVGTKTVKMKYHKNILNNRKVC